MSAQQDFVSEELSNIIKEFGVPEFTKEESETLDRLERELNKAIAEEQYPMSVLLRIRRIYKSKRRKKDDGSKDGNMDGE